MTGSRVPARTAARCLVDGAAPGAWNMALDEALMGAGRGGRVTLRFYRWRPACLSLGRNQEARGRYDREELRGRGIQVVRRPTGGRAVYHDRELTYSLTAPADRWGGLRESYRRVNRALLRGLRGVGVAVGAAGEGKRRESPRPSLRACFRDPLPGEIVARGRKLIGSAQWRRGGALLQHGSILLHDDQEVVERVRRGRGAAAGAAPGGTGELRAAALAELPRGVPPLGRLVAALRRGVEEELGVRVSAAPGPERAELEEAERLSERYSSPEWTWRR